MPTLGVICGMESEAEALGPLAKHRRVLVGISAGNPRRAERIAWRFLQEGCVVLLSWGICAGLDPQARAGDIMVPAEVEDHKAKRHPFARRLFERGFTEDGPLALGLERPVLSVEDKTALWDAKGAVCADMESHRVGLVGASSAVATVAVRAVADPADRDLPEYVARALDDHGRPRIGAVLAGLIQQPATLGLLRQLRRDNRAAHEALREVAEGGFLHPLLA